MECEGHSVPCLQLHNLHLPFLLAFHADSYLCCLTARLETQSNTVLDKSEAKVTVLALLEHL